MLIWQKEDTYEDGNREEVAVKINASFVINNSTIDGYRISSSLGDND
jgi:hypothetical protein